MGHAGFDRFTPSRQDRKTTLKIKTLIEDVVRDLFSGKGTPEPLKPLPGNVGSRRITQEDRLVYRVYENKADFLQAKYHH